MSSGGQTQQVVTLHEELRLLLLQLSLVIGVFLQGVELRLDLGHLAHALAAGDISGIKTRRMSMVKMTMDQP